MIKLWGRCLVALIGCMVTQLCPEAVYCVSVGISLWKSNTNPEPRPGYLKQISPKHEETVLNPPKKTSGFCCLAPRSGQTLTLQVTFLSIKKAWEIMDEWESSRLHIKLRAVRRNRSHSPERLFSQNKQLSPKSPGLSLNRVISTDSDRIWNECETNSSFTRGNWTSPKHNALLNQTNPKPNRSEHLEKWTFNKTNRPNWSFRDHVSLLYINPLLATSVFETLKTQLADVFYVAQLKHFRHSTFKKWQRQRNFSFKIKTRGVKLKYSSINRSSGKNSNPIWLFKTDEKLLLFYSSIFSFVLLLPFTSLNWTLK